TDLRAADFTVTDAGKPCQIAQVEYVNAPRAIVFVVDDVDSPARRDIVQFLLVNFLNRRMEPADRVAIMPVSSGRPELTSDKAALAGTLARLFDDHAWLGQGAGFVQARGGQPYFHGPGSFEAVRGAVETLAALPGRKNIVLLTRGVGWPPYHRMELVRQLAARANQADIAIHLMDTFSPPAALMPPAGTAATVRLSMPVDPPSSMLMRPDPLAEGRGPADLARSTGGMVFKEPQRKVTFATPMRSPEGLTETSLALAAATEAGLEKMLAGMSGGYYAISYRSEAPQGDSPGIKIDLARSGQTAHWRAVPLQPAPAPAPALGLRTIPFVLADADAASQERRPVLRAMVAIDPAGLRFQAEPDGSKKATVQLEAEARGGTAPAALSNLFSKTPQQDPLRKSGACSMTLSAGEAAVLASRRLLCSVELAPPAAGPYMLWVKATDAASGATGTAYALALVRNFTRDRIWASTLELRRADSSGGDAAAPADANPVDRVFTAGDTITYRTEVVGAQADKKTGLAAIEISYQVLGAPGTPALALRDDGTMLTPSKGPKQLAAGRIALPRDMKPGHYILLLTAYGGPPPIRAAAKAGQSQRYVADRRVFDFQQMDFWVRER
ncbi:MAG TPA: hypothetical protein VMU19_13340, partial [Bryobacteraceae bacterium]|nr:hypothetical protein [Bryobacteraceae bacterium]